jgi:hypothetical protein
MTIAKPYINLSDAIWQDFTGLFMLPEPPESDVLESRPQFKSDAFYFPTPTQTFVNSSLGWGTLEGNSIGHVLNALAPHCVGTITLGQLLHGLDKQQISALTNFLKLLHERGLLRDARENEPHSLSDSELNIYTARINVIDAHTSSAAKRFQKYRETKMLVTGSELLLQAFIHVMLDSGILDLAFLEMPDSSTDWESLLNTYRRDDKQTIRSIKLSGNEEDDLRRVSQFGAVVSCLTPRLSSYFDQLVQQTSAVNVRAVVVGKDAWIIPACLGHQHFQHPPASTMNTTDFLIAGPTAEIIANLAHLEAFSAICGIDNLATKNIFSLCLKTMTYGGKEK